jgi:hypothetical protein
VDHLLWTEDAHAIAKAISDRAATLVGIKKKELWVDGTVTDRSLEELYKLGWSVKNNSDAILDWKEEAKKKKAPPR